MKRGDKAYLAIKAFRRVSADDYRSRISLTSLVVDASVRRPNAVVVGAIVGSVRILSNKAVITLVPR